jgi:hypothetical protein
MPRPRLSVVFADYGQFCLQDVGAFAAWMRAEGDTDRDRPPGGWTEDAVHVFRIGTEPHSISIGTARTDFVETALQLLAGASQPSR